MTGSFSQCKSTFMHLILTLDLEIINVKEQMANIVYLNINGQDYTKNQVEKVFFVYMFALLIRFSSCRTKSEDAAK